MALIIWSKTNVFCITLYCALLLIPVQSIRIPMQDTNHHQASQIRWKIQSIISILGSEHSTSTRLNHSRKV